MNWYARTFFQHYEYGLDAVGYVEAEFGLGCVAQDFRRGVFGV